MQKNTHAVADDIDTFGIPDAMPCSLQLFLCRGLSQFVLLINRTLRR